MQSGGRAYGLAVALMVGAAVAAGPGTAHADSGDDAGAKAPPSSAESARPTNHAKSPTTRHDDGSPTKRPSTRTSSADPSESQTSTAPTLSDEKSDSPTAGPTGSAPRVHRSRRGSATTSTGAQVHRARVTGSQPVAPKTADEDTTSAGSAATPSDTGSPTPAPATVHVEVPTPTAEAAPAAPAAETVTAALVRATDTLDQVSDHGPATPAQTALLGLLAGFARHEALRGTRTHLITVKTDSTELVDDVAPPGNALAAPAALTGTDAATPDPLPVEQTRVPVVTTKVAPLAFLQRLPIIGPLIVTPIVALIHQIPLVSDLLHPFIGYPLDRNAPAGSAQPRDVSLVSFDGTRISVHFMPAEGLPAGHPAPTILYGPGLPMPGATNIDGTILDDTLADTLGMVSIAKLRAAGYNVVTWDPRGEYYSGGRMEIDSPDFEARDVSAIISWVSSLPEAQLDSALDPRIGMVGVSYGGGIQLVTAGIDKRVDAIVPTIAWNSLNTSLDKSGAPKTSWATLLTAVILLTGGHPNPQIYAAVVHGFFTGHLTQADTYFLTDRGAGALSAAHITVPTLLIQGTVDTLFSLQEADAIEQVLLRNGVTTKMLWFCGGHGLCTNDPFDPTDGEIIWDRTLDWLNRYVKGDTSVPTGPAFEWVDQHGQWYSSNTYQLPPADPIVVSGGAGKVLKLIPVLGGSGSLPLLPWASKAANAVNVTSAAATTTTYLVGAPQLTLTYSGTGTSKFVYAQLVDDSTGLVLGDQITPIPVTLDNQTHSVTVSLESVAATLAPGSTVTLQLVAESGTYQEIAPTLGELFSNGRLTVAGLTLTLPTVSAAAVSPTAPPTSTAA